MAIIKRKIPVLNFPIHKDFPVKDIIPGHEMDRDFSESPPTYVEALYTLIIMNPIDGQTFIDAIESHDIAKSLLTAESNNQDYFLVEESMYQKHIASKLTCYKFQSWTQPMLDFILHIRNSEQVL